jgi:hypothetical protein
MKHLSAPLTLLILLGTLVLTLAHPTPAYACGPNGQTVAIVFEGKIGDTFDVFVNGQKDGSFTVQKIDGVNYIFGGKDVKIEPGKDNTIEVRSGGKIIWSGKEKCTAPTGVVTWIGNTPNAGVGGDPVSTSMGEYFFTQPLLNLGGIIPLEFSLRYAANVNKSLVAEIDPFPGIGFTHNFSIFLRECFLNG